MKQVRSFSLEWDEKKGVYTALLPTQSKIVKFDVENKHYPYILVLVDYGNSIMQEVHFLLRLNDHPVPITFDYVDSHAVALNRNWHLFQMIPTNQPPVKRIDSHFVTHAHKTLH